MFPKSHKLVCLYFNKPTGSRSLSWLVLSFNSLPHSSFTRFSYIHYFNVEVKKNPFIYKYSNALTHVQSTNKNENSVLEKPQSNERKHGRYTSLVFNNFYKMQKQKLMRVVFHKVQLFRGYYLIIIGKVRLPFFIKENNN